MECPLAAKAAKDVPEREEKHTLGEDILLLNEHMTAAYEAKKAIERAMGMHKERGQKTDDDVPFRVKALLEAFNEDNERFLIERIDEKAYVVWPLDGCLFYRLEKRIFVYLAGIIRKSPDNPKPLGYDEIDDLKESLAGYLEKGLGIERELREIGGKIVIKILGEYAD